MYQKIQDIVKLNKPITLILNNGFEDRSPRGAELMYDLGLKLNRVILLRYSGKENEKNYVKVSAIGRTLVCESSQYYEIDSRDAASLASILTDLDRDRDYVVCDVTGLSRYIILSTLTQIYRMGLRFSLMYTEAKEYYPRKKEFSSFLKLKDMSEAFNELTKYEEAEIMYSSNCEIEEVPELSGRIFPNHPVMLLAFLAFKRSRLSCILNQYETNARILIQTIPDRRDLKWREKALEIINFDLVDENKGNLLKLPTLNWKQTYESLMEIYWENHNGYRYNILLAPLGGKMQTVGAWYFAIKNPDIKVITSTPRKHFPEKYSIGYADTHFICMDPVYYDVKQEVEIA